jgi:hypothetical protein
MSSLNKKTNSLRLILFSYFSINYISSNEIIYNIENINLNPSEVTLIETDNILKKNINNNLASKNTTNFNKNIMDFMNDYKSPPIYFLLPNGYFSNSNMNSYFIGATISVIFFVIIKYKKANFSLLENLVLKLLPKDISDLIEDIPGELRNLVIKSIFQGFISPMLNTILGSNINTRFFFLLLFEVNENQDFLKRINKIFLIYSISAMFLSYVFNLIVWNMKESSSIMYFNIIRCIFVGIISGIFLKFCIYNTADNKEIKVDLLDIQKYFLYLYYIKQFVDNKNTHNITMEKFMKNPINTMNEIETLYKKDFINKYMPKFFILYCCIIYGYLFYHTWGTLNNLETLKKSKEIYKKENPETPMLAL